MLKAKNAVHPPLHLFVDVEGQGKKEYVFSSTFRVGRDEDCDLSIQHSHVSRHHLEMEFRDQCWWLHDLESTNG
ncbi:MAG: FHA domain-containing protein, partial [Rhodothermaceae bacterium]|nr:FHA domain-containing protein [Rhodothermaceae bacterium]